MAATVCAVALALAGCAPTTTLRARPAAQEGQRPMRFLALGDSYTIGEGVAESERWPVRLAALLARQGVAVGPPEIVARTGWTTDELAAGIGQARPAGAHALVTLLIGVNDQYRGRDEREYRSRFAGLLAQAVGFAGGAPGRVVVLSIPDWGVTPHAAGRDRAAIAAAIDRFNRINREESRRAGVHYLDVTVSSREAADDRSLLAADGLHPSGRMYARWAELALPVALVAIGQPTR
jgi:lysophospholipase L1-like esterase